jgi:hypothetical protein
MKIFPFLIFGVLVPALTLSASAQTRRQSRIGVELGYTRFNSRQTSDTFGGNGISISPAFGSFRSGTKQGVTQPDFGLNISRGNGNTLIIVPIGERYTKSLGEGAARPYVGASLNLAPTYSKIQTLGLGGRTSLAVGGSALAGINFGNRFNLEARYFALSKVRGYDISHFEFGAGLRF